MSDTSAVEQRVLGAVDDGRLTRLLQDMVRQKSYSNTPGEGALARWLGAYLTRLGLTVTHQEVAADRLNTIATLRGTAGGPAPGRARFMLNGHIDTNMAGLGWTHDPWAGDVEDGHIFGIGVSNMKAADAAMIEAANALVDAGVRLAGDLIVALVIGELQGGVGTVHMLDQGVRADHFIVGEPTDLSLLTLHAGAYDAEIHVYGETRHLSKMEEGVNAIEMACDVIGALNGLGFSGATREDYRGLQRINVGVIRGGMGDEFLEWRTPSLPDHCMIRVAGRYAPGQTPAGAVADIQAMLDRLRAHHPRLKATASLVATTQKQAMGPFEVDPRHPFVQEVARLHRLVRGTEPTIGDVPPYKFYGTDAAHLAERGGMLGVVYGPGGKFNTMPDERVALADLFAAARVYALAALRTCGVTP